MKLLFIIRNSFLAKIYWPLLAMILLISSRAHTFQDITLHKQRPTECLYSDVYSASDNTFILYNIVERMAQQPAIPTSKKQFIEAFLSLGARVYKDCQLTKSEYQSDFIQKVKIRKGVVNFEFKQRSFDLKMNRGVLSKSAVLRRSSGQYKKQIVYSYQKNGASLFTRVVGRIGREETSTIYILMYRDGKREFFEIQPSAGTQDIKSLKSIYVQENTKESSVVEGEIKVGVIGTGVDYNHPGIARYLAYRKSFEAQAQEIEQHRDHLLYKFYSNFDAYVKTYKSYKDLLGQIGFPIWMDQALHTSLPFDLVLASAKTSQVHHETAITSRILLAAPNVEQRARLSIYSVRRGYGEALDIDMDLVMSHFDKEGVRLVNMSFGVKCSTDYNNEEQRWDAIFKKYPHIIFVVSAGNDNFDAELEPFCPVKLSRKYKNVISVTAINNKGTLASYYGVSVNYGEEIDFATYADDLLVYPVYGKTDKKVVNKYGATSLATAEVSRMITRLLLAGEEVDAQTIKQRLERLNTYSPDLNGLVKNSSYLDENLLFSN